MSAKGTCKLLSVTVLMSVTSLAGTGCQQKMDIVDTAAANPSFGTLVKAVQAAGLVDALKGEGPFTVFAPTNAAFAKLPSGALEDLLRPEKRSALQSILKYHVVPGNVMAKDVAALTSAETLEGKDLKITTAHGEVMVDGARVTQTDIKCSNGVIHVIDSVMMP